MCTEIQDKSTSNIMMTIQKKDTYRTLVEPNQRTTKCPDTAATQTTSPVDQYQDYHNTETVHHIPKRYD